MSLITNGDLSQLHLSRAVTEGLCSLLALILHGTTRWRCSYSEGFLEPAMSRSEAACGRQALASSACGALGANDDAIHPGLEIAVFSLFLEGFLPLLPGSFTILTLRIPMLYKSTSGNGYLVPSCSRHHHFLIFLQTLFKWKKKLCLK